MTAKAGERSRQGRCPPDDFNGFCQAYNLESSMGKGANCGDNAAAESFFSNLKKECVRKRIYKS